MPKLENKKIAKNKKKLFIGASIILLLLFAISMSQRNFRDTICRETNGNFCIFAMPIKPVGQQFKQHLFEHGGSESYFKNVKQVALYIQSPKWDEQEALRCHGIEEKCANERENRIPEYMRSNEITQNEYINKLKEDYKKYPKFLQPETMQNSFVPVLNDLFNIDSDIIILDSNEDLQRYLSKNDTLIVHIKYSIPDISGIRLTILQIIFYKSDKIYKDLPISLAIAIANGTSTEDAFKIITKNLKGISTLTIPKSH